MFFIKKSVLLTLQLCIYTIYYWIRCSLNKIVLFITFMHNSSWTSAIYLGSSQLFILNPNVQEEYGKTLIFFFTIGTAYHPMQQLPLLLCKKHLLSIKMPQHHPSHQEHQTWNNKEYLKPLIHRHNAICHWIFSHLCIGIDCSAISRDASGSVICKYKKRIVTPLYRNNHFQPSRHCPSEFSTRVSQ